MKVLFAVSNENISEAIIKRYPKEYRELLSYKNVYYFNAILKEIQKDKSYDRIVISEDLEPFVNANHDSIDNFIYEHLDKISDEAQGIGGKETSIILICSERRAPGSNILNKLFSIGIYNALLGKDRNMQELCRLINKPRTKKEAKLYYRIDQATYDPAADMGEVNEVEIQNILTHFRKLGKNTERYSDSFNNIAAQYTDEQLKIIINVLPIKVKAVLETESAKYQSLMGPSVESIKIEKQVEPGIKVNTIGSGAGINGPIVIPSGIKRVVPNNVNTIDSTVVEKGQQNVKNVVKVQRQNQQMQNGAKSSANTINQLQKNTMVQNNVQESITQKNSEVQQSRFTGNISQVKNNISQTKIADTSLPQIDEDVLENDIEEKRGRGRPRKLVTEQPKPKGKRGRPKKNIETEDETLNNLLGNINSGNDNILPGLEDNDNGILPRLEDSDDRMLPGLDDNFSNIVDIEDESDGEEVDVSSLLAGLDNLDGDIITTENDETLPGLDDNDDGMLPGLEDNDDGMLPGLDDNDDGMLSGLDDSDNGMLPGLDDNDDGMLPGLEDNDDGMLPGLEDNDDGMLPGLDDNDDGMLPGLEDNDDGMLPGLDDNDETILPGMGFQDTMDTLENSSVTNVINNQSTLNSNTYNNISNQNVTAVESIKPKIDYSMSNLNSLLSKDKKIVTFLGTTKNGTSFLVNNLALMFSLMGIDVAILDMTQNRNSYYIFTDSREELRNIAYTSISKLENGYAEGIKVNKCLTVYTALPADGNTYENAEPILSTLVQNHSLILIDCDFETPPAYFASCQEIYLVQSMDILTIQPLTAFLRELKFKGVWEPEKVRVVINKETNIRCLNNKTIIAGMSRYNGPDMSVMTDLFNRDMVKACSIPFDEKVYAKYLETMATCKLSLSGYSKQFMSKLQVLGEMVYPRLNSKKSYDPTEKMGNMGMNSGNAFSNSTNNTLNKMKNRY